MNQFFNKFHALMMHAKSAGHRPTRWSFGFGSRAEIMNHLDFTSYNEHPLEKLFGIPTEFDPDLPDMRVVLKDGKNTCGAFTIGYEDPKP